MEANRRYTTMVFPQHFDGKTLSLNIVLIPRNQNPFDPQSTGLPAPNNKAAAFADLKPQFEIKVVKGLDEWPIANSSIPENIPEKIAVTTNEAKNKKALLTAISTDFGLKINPNYTEEFETKEFTVNKYLPESYRNSFSFNSPRVKNAKTDDSYHCMLKKKVEKDDHWRNSDDVSWGQVFAHILRQPMLARACGMVYSTSIRVDEHPDWFSKGSYIFVELINPDLKNIQDALYESTDGAIVKPYAARLPKLEAGKKRPVFAPLVVPVLFSKGGTDPNPDDIKAPWDQIFSEINEYNDGFAKIIHAMQPVSNDLLSEQQDGNHPVNDAGIRLAWDDEQILIWYIRQLTNNPDDPAKKRIDVPMGVFGYKIDVRVAGNKKWHSLNLVKSKQAYQIGNVAIGNKAGDLVELPYQVFPTQPDNNKNGAFWLPMYYTAWVGKSLVLKDTDAIRIYRNHDELDADGNPKSVSDVNLFDEGSALPDLRYGKSYEFRVRLMDLSGGGPAISDELLNNSACPTAKINFKRYVAPGLCRIEKPEELVNAKTIYFNESLSGGESTFDQNPSLKIKRPVLTYPAVVFTGKYENPVDLLIQSSAAQSAVPGASGKASITPAIADPDVTHAEIKVEVETLRLDNLASDSGQDNYITLYTVQRKFSDNFDEEMNIPVVFRDINILNLSDSSDPFFDPELNETALGGMTEIVLPTARQIRVTIRAYCANETPEYFGFRNINPDLDSRYGKTTTFLFYKESETESDLLSPKQNIAPVKSVYLQPDPAPVRLSKFSIPYFHLEDQNNLPDIVQRLAQQLGVQSRGLTLTAHKGERVIFGCSARIQHHLAPDNSSITFGTKGDLSGHWIGCLVYKINRDWTWDGMQETSFSITRKKNFKKSSRVETILAGEIELKRSASFESLQPDDYGLINRDHTTLIFLDAIEPKQAITEPGKPLPFPDELSISYTITPNMKPGHGSVPVRNEDNLKLPATIPPAQTPEIVSVGMAFSKYMRNEKYSATEPRQRYLWVELKEPVKDPNDTLFCRVLGYGTDQLLANNMEVVTTILPGTPKDPPLPIDPEYVRSITPAQTDDMAGLGAMQPMEKAGGDMGVHYLLPLPPGLHAESPELFGFFTYEFRIGHMHWRASTGQQDNLWSTAQGRFGLPLRITGMQHPAPSLLCVVNRNKDLAYVTAPYARAVMNGKDFTCDPPRTQLHCVLYAQVSQADGLEYRNILLGEKLMTMDTRMQADEEKQDTGLRDYVFDMYEKVIPGLKSTDIQTRADYILNTFADIITAKDLKLDRKTTTTVQTLLQQRNLGMTIKTDIHTAAAIVKGFDQHVKNPVEIKPAVPVIQKKFDEASLIKGAKLAIEKDRIKTASCTWSDDEIKNRLQYNGLPDDSPLSVIVVEVFGNISNIAEFAGTSQGSRGFLAGRIPESQKEKERQSAMALGDQLGNYRILRTSPLTELPFVCCTSC